MSTSESDHLIADEGLKTLFAPLRQATAVIAAVSGGPDSMALMHLLARWKRLEAGPPVIAATVEHGLRPEGRAEAAMVAEAAKRLSLSHHILPWTGPKPRARIQEAAREARYRLLLGLARREGASHLVTAHTRDDQAETVLMRLSRGSGLAGLAGMRRSIDRQGILHVRPLLGTPKAVLIDLCRREGWPYADDPSNRDDRFARARWRKLMPLLAEEGLTAERLARLAERALRVEEALDLKAREALGQAIVSTERGAARLRGSVLAEEPFEIALRILALALADRGAAADHWRLERLEACTERLRSALRGRKTLRVTLAGAVIAVDREGTIEIGPEPPRRRGRYPSVRDDAAGAPHSLGKGGGHA